MKSGTGFTLIRGKAIPLIQSLSKGLHVVKKPVIARPLIDATTGRPFKHPNNLVDEPDSHTPILTIHNVNVAHY